MRIFNNLKRSAGICIIFLLLITPQTYGLEFTSARPLVESPTVFLQRENRERIVYIPHVYSEEEEQTYTTTTKKRINNLIELGVNRDLFENLVVKIYPSTYVFNNSKIYLGHCVKNYSSKGIIKYEIALAMVDEKTLYHEIGHLVHFKYLEVIGYGWPPYSDNYPAYLRQEYINLKNYTHATDYMTQTELPWEDRLSEWFAEDIKQIIMAQKGLPSERRTGPELTPEVEQFLKSLIFNKGD